MTELRIPDELDEALSPSWLTAALGQWYPGIEVVDVEPGEVVQRVSTNARFRIQCAGETPADVSEYLCLKGYFGDGAKHFRFVGEPEARFYRDLAARTGVHTLHPAWAGVDPASRHGVVISEDLVPQGARFLEPGADFSVDQLALSLGELATLHASTWEETPGEDPAWTISPMGNIAAGRGREVIEANFDGPIGARIPEGVRDARRLHALYPVLAARAGEVRPRPVLHGDAHVGNLFVDAEGRPGFLDWQLVHRGPWYLDVGYHIASCLPVEARRTHEENLLSRYLDRLAAAGVEPPTYGGACSEIGLGMVHGFYLWSITQQVRPDITTELLERLGTAVADHGALDALEAG